MICRTSPTRRVAGPQAIVVGRHGVVLERDGRSAVFLPQVAPEQGWDREAYLEGLCFKAGIPAGAWRGPDVSLSAFEAEVWAEE